MIARVLLALLLMAGVAHAESTDVFFGPDMLVPNFYQWLKSTNAALNNLHIYEGLRTLAVPIIFVFTVIKAIEHFAQGSITQVGMAFARCLVAVLLVSAPSMTINGAAMQDVLWQTYAKVHKTARAQSIGKINTELRDITVEFGKRLGELAMAFPSGKSVFLMKTVISLYNDAPQDDKAKEVADKYVQGLIKNAPKYAKEEVEQNAKTFSQTMWLAKIAYFAILPLLAIYALLMYTSGLTILICMEVWPLVVTTYALGSSQGIRYTAITSLGSVVTGAFLPYAFAVAINVAYMQPMKVLYSTVEAFVTDIKARQSSTESSWGELWDNIMAGGITEGVMNTMMSKVVNEAETFFMSILGMVVGWVLMIFLLIVGGSIAAKKLSFVPKLIMDLLGAASMGNPSVNASRTPRMGNLFGSSRKSSGTSGGGGQKASSSSNQAAPAAATSPAVNHTASVPSGQRAPAPPVNVGPAGSSAVNSTLSGAKTGAAAGPVGIAVGTAVAVGTSAVNAVVQNAQNTVNQTAVNSSSPPPQVNHGPKTSTPAN